MSNLLTLAVLWLAPFVDDHTLAVFRLDAAKVDAAQLFERLEKIETFTVPQEARTFIVQWQKAFLKAGGKDVFFLLDAAVIRQHPTLVVPVHAGADRDALLGLCAKIPGVKAEIKGNVILVGDEDSLERMRRQAAKPGKPRAELAQGFAGLGEGFFQALFVPSDTFRRAVEETLPRLPDELGGGATTDLTRGIRWAGVSVSLDGAFSVRGIVQTENDLTAQKLEQVVLKALAHAEQVPVVKSLKLDLEKIKKLMLPKATADRLTWMLGEDSLQVVVAPLLRGAQGRAELQGAVNNLKQIALALHSYVDLHKTFPLPATLGPQGKLLLSWRVHILPYLDQQDLYKEFRLDEPWDSPHNKKLIPRMPEVYFHSPVPKQGVLLKTRYLAPVGKDTIFPGGKGIRFADINDGLAATIMVVEVPEDRAVIWTKPDDFSVDVKDLRQALLGKSDRFAAAFADGSVRVFPASTTHAELHAFFTRSGAER